MRELTLLGHEVRQMPAKDVRAYECGDAICDAVRQPNDADLCM